MDVSKDSAVSIFLVNPTKLHDVTSRSSSPP